MAEQRCPVEISRCPHALESAEIAVKKVFAILGVDVDVPKEVKEFQENLRFSADLRREHADRYKVTQSTIIALFIGVLASLLFSGFLGKISGG